MSPRFTLNKEDLVSIVKVIFWSASSATVAGLLAVISSPDVQLPVWVLSLVPAINTFLYAVQKWLADNK